MGVWAVTEDGWWKVLSFYALIGTEVLITICCSFMKDSTLRITAYTIRSCCSLCVLGVGWVYWLSAYFQSWGHNPRDTFSFCCICCSTQPKASGVADTSNSNGSSASEMPRDLIWFTSIFVFSKVDCCSHSQSHTCPFLPDSTKDGGTLPGKE